MKNNPSFNDSFTDDNSFVADTNFIEWLKNKSKEVQIIAFLLIISVALVSTILLSYSLIYTLLPLIWHWGFDATITWQNASFTIAGFLSVLGCLYLFFIGLTPLILFSDSIHNIYSILTSTTEKNSRHTSINMLVKNHIPSDQPRIMQILESKK